MNIIVAQQHFALPHSQSQIINPTPLNVRQIAASIEKNLIPRLSNSPPDIESLRLYLTLPESPLFCDRNNYVTIVIPFAKSIINLKEAALKVLGKTTSVATQISHLGHLLSFLTFHAPDMLLHQEIGGPNLSPRSSSDW